MRKRTIFLLILAVVLACVLFFCRFYFLGTSSDPVKAKTNVDFQIPDFHSQTDKDADGIDDQTDLSQAPAPILPPSPATKVSITKRAILTMAMVSAPTSLPMPCYPQAMT